jgi:hypothetical protein
MMNSDPAYVALAEALESRLALIADREWVQRDAAGHLEALGEISGKIETLAAALPRPLNGELAHYLERRSYDKALAWIKS